MGVIAWLTYTDPLWTFLDFVVNAILAGALIWATVYLYRATREQSWAAQVAQLPVILPQETQETKEDAQPTDTFVSQSDVKMPGRLPAGCQQQPPAGQYCIRLTLCNDGDGPAINIEASLSLGECEYSPAVLLTRTLAERQSEPMTFELGKDLPTSFPNPGGLVITYRDMFKQPLTTRCEVHFKCQQKESFELPIELHKIQPTLPKGIASLAPTPSAPGSSGS